MSDASNLPDSAVADRLHASAVEPAFFAPLTRHVTPDRTAIEVDDDRDRLLAEVRSALHDQVAHDAAFNIQELRQWAADTARTGDPIVADSLARLTAGHAELSDTNEWSTSQAELRAWNAFHQFYCDALLLGDRLLRMDKGLRPQPTNAARRCAVAGGSSYQTLQAKLNMIEQAFPNIMDIKLRGLLSVVRYQLARTVLPRPIWRSRGYIESCHPALTRGTLASYGTTPSPVVIEGRDALFNDAQLFDGAGRTRHNIIVVMSHRHSFLDFCLQAEAFGRRPYAMWSHTQYFPKSAELDPLTVSIKPGKTRHLDNVMAQSKELIVDQRYVLGTYADGGSPYLAYGQQMRIKPGLRQLVDTVVEGSRGTGRRTYVVPLSYDDTVSYIRRLDDTIRITFHTPIEASDIPPAPRPAKRHLPNRGDPLINHIECHFLAHTGQTRHGWWTPDVVETVQRIHQQPVVNGGMRGWLRKRCHATILDLART